jgi:histone deacetylase 6
MDNKFQVIDVNIPKIVAVENVSQDSSKDIPNLMKEQPDDGYVKADDSATRALQTRELAAYIWENYIE